MTLEKIATKVAKQAVKRGEIKREQLKPYEQDALKVLVTLHESSSPDEFRKLAHQLALRGL